MLEGEEELAVSEEDFSMTSEPEEEENLKPLSLGEMILKNKAIQEQVKANLLLKKLEHSVPDRIGKLPSHTHLKHELKLLWKDHSRLLTLSHHLSDCDCSGNQLAETKLVFDFEERQAAYLANEAALKKKAEAIKAKAAAKKAKKARRRAAAGSDSDSEFGSGARSSGSDSNSDSDSLDNSSNDLSNSNSDADDVSYISGETKATGRGSDTNEEDENKSKADNKEDLGLRDSDDDIEPPPDIPPITLAFLCNVMNGKKTLEGIQFDENPFGTKGTIELCKTLSTLPNLTILNLSAVDAGLAGARALGDVLRSSNLQRTLRSLIFGYNDIGPEGVQAIVEAVGRRCRALETLRLHNNNIKSDGAVIVARELVQCKGLRVLDLGGNDIGDRGVEMLAEYIGDNSSLKRINLQNNLFTQRGAHSLVHVMHLIRQFPIGQRIQRLSVVQCRRLKDGTKTELKDAAELLEDFRLMV